MNVEAYMPTALINGSVNQLKKQIGDSALAQQQIEEFRGKVTERTRQILVEYSSILPSIQKLDKRAISAITTATRNLDIRRIARAARILPAFCYRIGPDPKMPNKQLEQQNSNQLARALAISYAPLIDYGLSHVPFFINKISPMLRHRIIKSTAKKFRAEWIREDLLAQATFMHSASGRRTIEMVIKIDAMIRGETTKANLAYKKKRREEWAANRPKDPMKAMLYDVEGIMNAHIPF